MPEATQQETDPSPRHMIPLSQYLDSSSVKIPKCCPTQKSVGIWIRELAALQNIPEHSHSDPFVPH